MLHVGTELLFEIWFHKKYPFGCGGRSAVSCFIFIINIFYAGRVYSTKKLPDKKLEYYTETSYNKFIYIDEA